MEDEESLIKFCSSVEDEMDIQDLSFPASTSVFHQLPNTPPNSTSCERNFFFGSREALRQKPPSQADQSNKEVSEAQQVADKVEEEKSEVRAKRLRSPTLSREPMEKPAKKSKPETLPKIKVLKKTLKTPPKSSDTSKPTQSPKSKQLPNPKQAKVEKPQKNSKKRQPTHRDRSETPPAKRSRSSK